MPLLPCLLTNSTCVDTGSALYSISACDSIYELYEQITSTNFVAPQSFATDSDVVCLMSALMRTEPEHRLGCGEGGIGEVKHHKWFTYANFDWGKLSQLEMAPFHTPEVKDLGDVPKVAYSAVHSTLLASKPCAKVLWGSHVIH